MSETIDNAKLLEMNYNSQLDALREIGMLSDGEVIGLGEIADYMKWAGGLLDVQLAKADKSDGKLVLFKTEEWDALSSNQQGNYLTVGVRVRADGQDFLVSKDNIKTSSGTYTMKWSEEYVNVTGLKDYGDGSTGIYDDFDAAGMTDAICSFAALRGVEYLPGQLSRAYKACTVEVDGVDDPVVWSCATLAHLLILCKYRTQINEVISTYIGSSFIIAPERYWAANEYNNWYAYYIHLGSGLVYINNYKTNVTYRVRAVSAL